MKGARVDARPIDLIYTGQLYHWKGAHTLIEALRWLPSETRLMLVGGNSINDVYALQMFAKNLGVAERIDWRGQVSHREVLTLQCQAKVGLVPLPFTYPIARWYTSPIKIFELMAAGTALLVSAVPALRELLKDGETAMFARPDNPRDWATRIGQLLGDPALRERLARQAQKLVRGLTFEARARTIIQHIDVPAAGAAPIPDRPVSGA